MSQDIVDTWEYHYHEVVRERDALRAQLAEAQRLLADCRSTGMFLLHQESEERNTLAIEYGQLEQQLTDLKAAALDLLNCLDRVGYGAGSEQAMALMDRAYDKLERLVGEEGAG